MLLLLINRIVKKQNQWLAKLVLPNINIATSERKNIKLIKIPLSLDLSMINNLTVSCLII